MITMRRRRRRVIKELLRRYPAAASTRTQEGQYPLMILEHVRGKMTTDAEIQDLNRKSDLLFAYHPNVPPYCNDIDRLERFGMRLCDDIDESRTLSETSRLVWRWMIMVPERNDPEGLYLSIITSIVRCLGVEGARTLALLVDEESGRCYHEIAASQTKKLLKSYLRFADRYELGDDDDDGGKVDNDQKQDNDKSVVVERTSTSVTMRARDYHEEMMTDDPLLRGNGMTEAGRVMIKFFARLHDFEREAQYADAASSGNDGVAPLPVVPIIETYNVDRIGTAEETMGDRSYQRDLRTSKISTGGWDVSRFPYAIVTPSTGRSLEQVFNSGKYGEEVEGGDDSGVGGLSEAEMRGYVRQLGHALDSLHQHGLSYNDINLSSIVTYNNTLLFSSLSSMTTTISPEENFHGLPTSSLKSAILPPEMIAKLDRDGVNQYYKYWKPVVRDARVYQLCCLPQDLALISHHVNEYLGYDGETTKRASFSHLWDRVKENAKLWKRIRPRSIDDSYYVIKCYATLQSPLTSYNPSTSPLSPLHPHRLPYTLIPISPTIDVWTFAIFLFSHATNTTSTTSTNDTLFAMNNNGDLCHNADFATLHHWSIDSLYADERLETIDDPLLRDLLRLLLTPADERPETLEEILNHPFFAWDVRDESLRDYARNVIVGEDNRKRDQKETALMEKSVVLRREMEESWLSGNTRIVERLTPRMHLTMDRATWRRWTSCLMMEDGCVPSGGSTFPTCYIVVPYEMITWDEDGDGYDEDYDEDGARAATTTSVVSAPYDTEKAITTGRLFARWLYFTSLVSLVESSPRYSDDDNASFQTDSSKLSHFTDLNRASMAYAETNVIDICEGIVKRASNAVTILAEVLEKYLPKGGTDVKGTAGDDDDDKNEKSASAGAATTVAEVIVRQVLTDIVDLGVCEDITKRAKEAGKAFTVFSKHIDDDIDGDLKRTLRKGINNPATSDNSGSISNSDEDEKASMRLVNENYEELLGSDFCSQSISRKMDVEMALFGLIKDYVEDPLSAIKTIAMKVMNELMEHMLRQEQFYFYLVDELTGRPVVQRRGRRGQQQHPSEEDDDENGDAVTSYPIALEANRDTLGLLIPGLYLSLRSLVETSGILGLGKLLGLEMSRIPKEWKSIAPPTYMSSSTSSNASHTEMEYRLLRDILEEQSSSNNNNTHHDDNNFNFNGHDDNNNNTISYAAPDVLSSYEQFLQSFDPSRDYSGMHRVCGPDDLVIWTSDAGEMSIQRDDQRDLETLSLATRKEADDVLERLWKTKSTTTGASTTKGDNGSKRRGIKSHMNSYHRQEGLKIWSQDDALRALTDDKLLNKKMDNNTLLIPKAPLLPKVVTADKNEQPSLRLSFSDDSSIITMTDATLISAFGNNSLAGAQSMTTLVVYDENSKALTIRQQSQDDGNSESTATFTPYHKEATTSLGKKQKTPASLSFRTSLRSDREKQNQEARMKMLSAGGCSSAIAVTTMAAKETAEDKIVKRSNHDGNGAVAVPSSASSSLPVKGVSSNGSGNIMKGVNNMRGGGMTATAMTPAATNSTNSSTAFRSFHRKKTETNDTTSRSTDQQQHQDDNNNNKAGGWLKKKNKSNNNNNSNSMTPPPPPTPPQPAESASRILSSPPQKRDFMSSKLRSSPLRSSPLRSSPISNEVNADGAAPVGVKKTLFGKGNNSESMKTSSMMQQQPAVSASATSSGNAMMSQKDDQLKTPRRLNKFSNTTSHQPSPAGAQCDENKKLESDFVMTHEEQQHDQQQQDQQDYQDDYEQDLPYDQSNNIFNNINNAHDDDMNNGNNDNNDDNFHLTIQPAKSYDSDASTESSESKLAMKRYLGPIRAAASPAHHLMKKQQQDENGGVSKWNNIFKERSSAQQPQPSKTMKTVGLGMIMTANNVVAPGRNMMNNVSSVAAAGTTTAATDGDECHVNSNNIADDSGPDQIIHNISDVTFSPQTHESTEADKDKIMGQQQQQGGSGKFASPLRRSPTNNNNFNNNYNSRGSTPSPYRTINNSMRTSTPRGAQNIQNSFNNPMRTSTPRGAQNVQDNFKAMNNNNGTTTNNSRPFDSNNFNSVEGGNNDVNNTSTYDNENNMNSANSIMNNSTAPSFVNGDMTNNGGSKGFVTAGTPRRRFNMNSYPSAQKQSSSTANSDYQTNNNSGSSSSNNAPSNLQPSSSSASPFRSSPYNKQRNNDYRMNMNSNKSSNNNNSVPPSHSFPSPLPPQQPQQRLNHPPTLGQIQQQVTPPQPKPRRSPTALSCPSPSAAMYSSNNNNNAPWSSSTPSQSSRRPSSSRHSTSSSQQNMFSMRKASTPMGSSSPSPSPFSKDDGGYNNSSNGNMSSRGGGSGSGGFQQQPQRSRNDFFRQYRNQLGESN